MARDHLSIQKGPQIVIRDTTAIIIVVVVVIMIMIIIMIIIIIIIICYNEVNRAINFNERTTLKYSPFCLVIVFVKSIEAMCLCREIRCSWSSADRQCSN